MKCPKDRHPLTEDRLLVGELPAKCCPDCKGTWIAAEFYRAWQERQQPNPVPPEKLSGYLDVDYVQSNADLKAGLCPDCGRYLARAKVNLKPAFYVERCPHCKGIWCDRGEWEVLKTLGLHATIDLLFTSEWQARVREGQQREKERQIVREKLGDDLAQRVFELADALERHPSGDFGVAFLMRRFEKHHGARGDRGEP